jgi:DNA-binding winged helix-turn-helix (wHTH) protein
MLRSRVQFDDLTFDPASRQLWSAGREVKLSPKAFELLALLIERRPSAVSKQEIRERLWPGTFVSESSLPTLVSEVRDVIGDSRREPRFLRTLHGFGYAFQAPGETSSDATPHGGSQTSAWLVGPEREIELRAGENVLGREGPGVIVIKSSTVSRRHVRISIAETSAEVEDLGSKNGTYVNDRRVTETTPLLEGDQVRIGSLLFTFRQSQPTSTTETQSSFTSRTPRR